MMKSALSYGAAFKLRETLKVRASRCRAINWAKKSQSVNLSLAYNQHKVSGLTLFLC